MTRKSRLLLLWAALAALPVSASAAVRVDDTGTVVSTPVLPMRWRQLVPGRGADHSVEAQVRIAVRLNLARWLNQPVRLYMVLAPGEVAVTASWRTQGRLLPGSLRSGSRALVYAGHVSVAMLEETIDLALSTDGRNLEAPQALQFSFELDTP